MSSNPVEDLFPEDAPDKDASVEVIMRKLGDNGIWNLAYAGEHGSNPGYIFRGEAAHDIPLQCSLELHCRTAGIPLDERGLREKEVVLLRDFLTGEGPPLVRLIDPDAGAKSWDDVWWWLTLMQHYERKTRLVDFTRDIRVALYFAIEQQKNHPDKDMIIYCFPCRDLQHPRDEKSNKCPFHPTKLCRSIDMNFVIGNQLELTWMEPHKGWLKDDKGNVSEKYFKKTQRKWGWDRPYFQNPRIEFQKGMFVYPYDYPKAPLCKADQQSWLELNLRQSKSDPFNFPSTLPPKRIRIDREHAPALKKYLREWFQLTAATVYLDYQRHESAS